MKIEPGDMVLDDESINRIRTDARAVITGEGLSQRAAADEAVIASGTFNAWLAGTYQGHNDKVAAQVLRWLEARKLRSKITSIVPVAPPFMQTMTAQRIVEVMQWAQTLKDMGLIIGPPGTGKTCAGRYYAAANPAVYLATMSPAKSSTHHLLIELGKVCKVPERSTLKIADAIVQRLAGRNALLLIDEAQHLRSEAVDQLRSIYDTADCGVVLMGNEGIVAKLGDPERSPQNAQLYSRFGMRLVLDRLPRSDVEALLKEWKVENKDEMAFMRAVATKPGALRALTKTMIAATAMAAGNNEPRTIAHLRDAWSRVGAGPIGNS
jgi:DNA transposition AAA+ family ATPase